MDLVRQVANLQKFFQFYSDRLIQVNEILEQKKQSITEEQLTIVMREFEKEWTEQEHNPMKITKTENKTLCFNVCRRPFLCFFLDFPSAI